MSDFSFTIVRKLPIVKHNHYFAYPVIYNGNRELVFCRAREDNNKNRLYVHEVFTESEIKKDNTLQTVASANNMVELRGGIVLYRTILKDIYNVNQNEISKVVDENGEPMVVWTGTDSAFNEFKPKKIGFYNRKKITHRQTLILRIRLFYCYVLQKPILL